MTLRRCDSLPTKLRVVPLGSPEVSEPFTDKVPDSNKDPHLNDTLVRDEVIATWKSLHTDVKNIKNGFPLKNYTLNHRPEKRISIKNHLYPSSGYYNRNAPRNNTYTNKHISVGAQDVDRSSSFPLDCGQRFTADKKTNSARRRTLLERLLSWRTPDCDCNNRCSSKLRHQPPPEDLLCTCGVAQEKFKDNQIKCAERERSKSVGYEAAREVTQFRRCASAGATVGAETASALRARAALTLARRYYPEGGWGWTITVVGTIVQILSHGLQLGGGTGAIACAASAKYKVQPLYTYGEGGSGYVGLSPTKPDGCRRRLSGTLRERFRTHPRRPRRSPRRRCPATQSILLYLAGLLIAEGSPCPPPKPAPSRRRPKPPPSRSQAEGLRSSKAPRPSPGPAPSRGGLPGESPPRRPPKVSRLPCTTQRVRGWDKPRTLVGYPRRYGYPHSCRTRLSTHIGAHSRTRQASTAGHGCQPSPAGKRHKSGTHHAQTYHRRAQPWRRTRQRTIQAVSCPDRLPTKHLL